MKTSLLLSKINYFIIAVLLFSSFTLYAQPKREFRATWLATVFNLDWPVKGATVADQKADLTSILTKLKAGNMNAVAFQVQSYSDALYLNALVPISEVMTGTRGATISYDPLQ